MIEILKSFNEFWLTNLNSLTQYAFIKNIVVIFADAPIFFLPMFLMSFWVIHNKKWENEKKWNLLFIFYSVILSISINLVLQKIVHIDRPENFLHVAWNMILNHIPDASFPSDHARVSTAFFTSMLLFWYKKSAFTILPFFIIMLLSRIIAWVHWPLDIIAWILVWIISWFTIFKFRNIFILKNLNKVIIKIASFIKL